MVYGFMAMRKMTSIPETLALQLQGRVALSEASAARLEKRDIALIHACEIANQELDGAKIEEEFDGMGDVMAVRRS